MRLSARIDDLASREVNDLILEHLQGMHGNSPPGTVYALPIDGLKRPEVTFWSIWSGADLCGCIALKELSTSSGEIKSMRTRAPFLRQGVGQFALDVLLQAARDRHYARLLLETGTGAAFEPARRLYSRNGFVPCRPFGDYQASAFNAFMARELMGTACLPGRPA